MKGSLRQNLTNLIAEILPSAIFRIGLPNRLVVYGHLVSNKNHPVAQYYKYPSLNEFNKMLDTFASMGYKFVSLQEYIQPDNGKKVLLTFDDGFRSIYEELHPFLKGRNIPYVIFILTDPLDDPDFYIKTIKPDDQFLGERMFLNSKEIMELKAQGVHIGFHTCNHIKLEVKHFREQEALKQLKIPEHYEGLFSHPLAFAYPYRAPDNFAEFNSFMSSKFDYKYFFDTKGFRKNQGNHFFRVSIDAEKDVDIQEWLTWNLKRQLLPRLKKIASLPTRKLDIFKRDHQKK